MNFWGHTVWTSHSLLNRLCRCPEAVRKSELRLTTRPTSSTQSILLSGGTPLSSFDEYATVSHTCFAASALCFHAWLTFMTAHLLVKFYTHFGVLIPVFPGLARSTHTYLLVTWTLHCTFLPVHVFSLGVGELWSDRGHHQWTAK